MVAGAVSSPVDRRGILVLCSSALSTALVGFSAIAPSALFAQSTEEPDDDGNVMPARPRLARVRGLHFESSALASAREALRPSATALLAHGTGREHRYEQHGYRSRRPLAPADLLLAALRTWGHPDRRDFVWYEQATPLSLDASAIADALRAVTLDAHGAPMPDPRPAPERDAVLAHATAFLAAARASSSLTLLAGTCGWADENGARTRGVALMDEASRELYWSYLFESSSA